MLNPLNMSVNISSFYFVLDLRICIKDNVTFINQYYRSEGDWRLINLYCGFFFKINSLGAIGRRKFYFDP